MVVRWANIGRAVWIIFLWADQPIRKYIQTGEHCPGRDAPAGPLEAPWWRHGGRALGMGEGGEELEELSDAAGDAGRPQVASKGWR